MSELKQEMENLINGVRDGSYSANSEAEARLALALKVAVVNLYDHEQFDDVCDGIRSALKGTYNESCGAI